MPSTPKPWPRVPVNPKNFQRPPREYGILPFWFLNGELETGEMQYQLKEFREKGMPGIILHGRYGLEMPYIGEKYLDRIRFAVEEAKKLGLQTWIYDEMNWPSGTADKRVLEARPDLTQRYIECLNFFVRGPWFTYLTGADSRYIDFERSKPVAAFAVRLDGETAGQVIDLTPNLSFENVIPWEAPAGSWRLMYIVEKEADYYIDALNPEATREFLKIGYEPYAESVGEHLSNQMVGFYTDEPAMHYYVTGGDNPIVPWTKNMFRRFQERNGYNLRPRLPDLFFDISEESARVRYDFYTTITEFYSQAYYKQIYEWCEAHGVLFTGHLLYEEWLRRLIRVEGNVFKHYPYFHVIGVDHLYPIIGTRDRPDEHVAMKVGSSAAHQMRSPRLLCESFGGIFMDATMQRMKWIADWEYVLGVNLLNPHGFHYTLEGPRKRDWPPSQFYQYPWWQYYGVFSEYMSRLSHLLSGGRHVAKAAVLWPLNALFASYTPQSYNEAGERLLHDFNALTDLLLRVHYDFDYLDEDILAGAELGDDGIRVADESYPLLILPPVTHLKLETLNCLEQFVARGGRVMATIFLPHRAFGADGQVDITARIEALFGANPSATQRDYTARAGIDVTVRDHPGGGKTAFVQSYAIARNLPMRIQKEMGTPGRPNGQAFQVEASDAETKYYYTPAGRARVEITIEVNAERQEVADALEAALNRLVEPDVVITNPDIYYLHRVNDGQDVFFFVNSTFVEQSAQVTLSAERQPALWDPSTGQTRPAVPAKFYQGRVSFPITLPAAGSVFVVPAADDMPRILDANIVIDRVELGEIHGYGSTAHGFVVLEQDGKQRRLEASAQTDGRASVLPLDGPWEFLPQNDNALVIGRWLAQQAADPGADNAAPGLDTSAGWLEMGPGAWAYQLPAEPAQAYPIPVWYRIPFHAAHLPQKLDLIIDGFAGTEWQIYVNGEAVMQDPVRSAIDAQMKAVDISRYAQQGENLIAVRLLVSGPTGGLLDLIKLVGIFRVESGPDGQRTITVPEAQAAPTDWTKQGYPFYSGAGRYHTRFTVPANFTGKRVFLRASLFDDTLEVLVNGKSAGVRLWPPYEVEISDLLEPGKNTLDLRVANTLINLLEAVERPSGLSGAPELAAYPAFCIKVE
jgi:hypothetical protein